MQEKNDTHVNTSERERRRERKKTTYIGGTMSNNNKKKEDKSIRMRSTVVFFPILGMTDHSKKKSKQRES